MPSPRSGGSRGLAAFRLPYSSSGRDSREPDSASLESREAYNARSSIDQNANARFDHDLITPDSAVDTNILAYSIQLQTQQAPLYVAPSGQLTPSTRLQSEFGSFSRASNRDAQSMHRREVDYAIGRDSPSPNHAFETTGMDNAWSSIEGGMYDPAPLASPFADLADQALWDDPFNEPVNQDHQGIHPNQHMPNELPGLATYVAAGYDHPEDVTAQESAVDAAMWLQLLELPCVPVVDAAAGYVGDLQPELMVDKVAVNGSQLQPTLAVQPQDGDEVGTCYVCYQHTLFKPCTTCTGSIAHLCHVCCKKWLKSNQQGKCSICKRLYEPSTFMQIFEFYHALAAQAEATSQESDGGASSAFASHPPRLHVNRSPWRLQTASPEAHALPADTEYEPAEYEPAEHEPQRIRLRRQARE